MTLRVVSIVMMIVLLLTNKSVAQPPNKVQHNCFDIVVHLNGNRMDGPDMIMLYGNDFQIAINKIYGCFNIPNDIINKGDVDLSFTVQNESLYMLRLPVSRLDTLLDVEIEDKKFWYSVVIPKHTIIKKACYAVLREGDP